MSRTGHSVGLRSGWCLEACAGSLTLGFYAAKMLEVALPQPAERGRTVISMREVARQWKNPLSNSPILLVQSGPQKTR
jgi:hypothetical protein